MKVSTCKTGCGRVPCYIAGLAVTICLLWAFSNQFNLMRVTSKEQALLAALRQVLHPGAAACWRAAPWRCCLLACCTLALLLVGVLHPGAAACWCAASWRCCWLLCCILALLLVAVMLSAPA